jgi:Anti-sigma-K factor rskA
MTTRPPDFDDLVDMEVPAEERERLRRVHHLLLQADQPPELSPELDAVPWPNDALAPLSFRRRDQERRRSWLGLAAAAAAIALVAFIIGEGHNTRSAFKPVATTPMHGTRLAPNARATIAVGARGRDGNWPMLVDVTNLPPAPTNGYYVLWLSSNGKPVAPCGSFNTATKETVVRLSAAYSFAGTNGWVVTREAPGERHQVVMTT